jgi:hypothetical protein
MTGKENLSQLLIPKDSMHAWNRQEKKVSEVKKENMIYFKKELNND